jgi:hypothetical protein
MRILTRTTAIAIVATVMAAGASQARAESAADRAACTPSVLSLCPREALAGDRAAALQCLIANLAKASQRCQAVVRGATLAGSAQPSARLAAGDALRPR